MKIVLNKEALSEPPPFLLVFLLGKHLLFFFVFVLRQP